MRQRLSVKNWFDRVAGGVSRQGDLEDKQLTMGFETAEALGGFLHGGFLHGGSGPSQGHALHFSRISQQN